MLQHLDGETGIPVAPPEIAVSVPAEMLRRRPGWGRIPAVRRGQVFPVESERITRPGPRLVEGLEEIARRLHPKRFRSMRAQPAEDWKREGAKGAKYAK